MSANIQERIQKLLNMANGSVQGNEADVALKMAHDLMAAHGITMAELDAAGRDKELGALGQWNKGDKAYKVWERTLASAMAKLFDCQIVYGHPTSRKLSMNFIGREGNVKTAWIMYDWIHDKLWNDAKAKFVPYSAAACNSYCVGAANTIYSRVVEMKAQDDANGEGWGLVVVNEVTEYKHSLYPTLSKMNSRATVGDGRAYAAGSADGKGIGLNKQFGLKCIA